MGKFNSPLKALLSADLRDAQRHTLRLATSARTADRAAEVLIHNLSESGLSFETDAAIKIGEIVLVELPFIGAIEGKATWQKSRQFGIEFLTPVSNSDLSAALLRQSNGAENSEPGSLVEEVAIGIKPSLDEITEWKVDFEQTRSKLGYRLMGFRQTSEGVLIAMISKAS